MTHGTKFDWGKVYYAGIGLGYDHGYAAYRADEAEKRFNKRQEKMTMIKPTVGRVVLFHPSTNSADSGFTPPSPGEPCAAIVAKVWSDDMVNLAVFDANGVVHSRTSVNLVQEGEPKPPFGYYCEWMPYQIGQAKAQAAA